MSDATDLTDEELTFLSSMFEHARAGDTEALVAAVDAGLPVNLTNQQGDTLLVLAAYHRQAATVRALLAREADTERVNDRGQTALACAVFRRDREIAGALLDAGAGPATGERSALAIAEFFELEDMQTLLAR